MRSRWLLAAKLLLSAGLLVLLASQIPLHTFVEAIQDADLIVLSSAIAISAFTVLIRSMKWAMLLDIQGSTLSLSRVHAINYMAMFFNNFFLGSAGGDAFKIYKTFHDTRCKSGAISSVVVEKVTNLAALAGLVVMFGLLNADEFQLGVWGEAVRGVVAWAALGSLITGAIIGGILYGRNVSMPTVWSRMPRSAQRLADGMHTFIESIRLYTRYGRVIGAALVLSCVFYLGNALAMYVYALSVSVELSLMHLSFVVPAVFLIVMVPISVNGIGLQEGAWFMFLEELGVQPAAAVVVAVLPRVGTLLLSLVGGLLYMREHGHTGQLVSKEMRNIDQGRA